MPPVDGDPVYLVSDESQEQQIDHRIDDFPSLPVGNTQVKNLPGNVKDQEANRIANNVQPAARHVHDLAAQPANMPGLHVGQEE